MQKRSSLYRRPALSAMAFFAAPAFGQAAECATDEPLAIGRPFGIGAADIGQTETHYYDGAVPINISDLSPNNILFRARNFGAQLQEPDTLDFIAWNLLPFEYTTALSDYAGQDYYPSFFVAQQGRMSRFTNFGFMQTGDELWGRDMRRGSCVDDAIGDIAFQRAALSTPEFAARWGSADVVYAGTHYNLTGSCDGPDSVNQVVAMDAATASILWSFNQHQLFAVGNIAGLALDKARDGAYARTGSYGVDDLRVDAYQDRLFVTTDRSSTDQDTVWSINTLNGAREWSVNAGRIFNKPVVRGDRLYVANVAGEVKALNKTDGSELWSLRHHFFPFIKEFDVGRMKGYDDLIALVDYIGEIVLIRDNGNSAKVKWIVALDPDGAVKATTAPVIDDINGYVFVGANDGLIYQIDIKKGTVGATRTLATDGAAVADLLRQTPRKDASGNYVYTLVAVDNHGQEAQYCAPFAEPKGGPGKQKP